MDVHDELHRAEPRGPFGALTSGDVGGHARHFPGFDGLPEQARAAINTVWTGRRASCLVYDPRAGELLLVEFADAGETRGGRRYGYTVRSVTLLAAPERAAPSVEPAPEPAGAAPRRGNRSLLLLAPVLFGCGAFAGHYLAAWDADPVPRTAERRAELQRREAEVGAREARVKQDEADVRALLEQADQVKNARTALNDRLTEIEAALASATRAARDLDTQLAGLQTKLDRLRATPVAPPPQPLLPMQPAVPLNPVNPPGDSK
jgi:multidrug efflux pump subunit AcrA (membrane-fusion protein)